VYVYKMTNLVNGRVYIGKTIRGYRQRWKEHKDELNRGQHYNAWLQEDWKTYGEDGFTFELLVQCNSEEEANETKKRFILWYGSYNPVRGYNRTFGGDGGTHTDEVKQQISKTLTGFKRPPMSEETKEKLRKAALAQWERQRAEGYKYPPVSESTRTKLRAARAKQPPPSELAKVRMGASWRGKQKPPMSEATKQKIREARARQAPISEEGRRRISEFHKNRDYAPLSEEAKRKIRVARAKQVFSQESQVKKSASLKATWHRRKYGDGEGQLALLA
jgi:group I intron endonuclease